jgi:HK97 family phage major capsid protein
MPLYSSDAAGILTPEEVGQLVVQPVTRASVAMQVSTVVPTASAEFRIPIITADSSAAWTPEGQEITPSNPGVDELVVTPKKLAALTIISRELANDSSPEAQQVVGDSIARDLARKVDAAYFSVSTLNGPSGIEGTPEHQAVTPAGLANLDTFATAISLAEGVGATVTAFVANANTVLKLSKLKTRTDSNKPLLEPDPTLPTKRQILGVPLYSMLNIALPDDVIWAIDASRAFVVLRQDADLVVDHSAYFSSDRIGIRSTMRIGFGFPHEAALVRIGTPLGS